MQFLRPRDVRDVSKQEIAPNILLNTINNERIIAMSRNSDVAFQLHSYAAV